MEKIYFKELPTYSKQKSFNGKAHILVNNDVVYLYSYGTPVLMLKDGKLSKVWSGQSKTTSRHIKAFICHLEFNGFRYVKEF